MLTFIPIRSFSHKKKALISLIDFEDLFSIPIELNVQEILEEVSVGVDAMGSKLLSCELFWLKLSLADTSSIKDCFCTTEQTIFELADLIPDFFSERRILILKNRMILMNLLMKGKDYLAEAFEKLLELNMKEAENIISQQNLAVVALVMGKKEEARVLLSKIGASYVVRFLLE